MTYKEKGKGYQQFEFYSSKAESSERKRQAENYRKMIMRKSYDCQVTLARCEKCGLMYNADTEHKCKAVASND